MLVFFCRVLPQMKINEAIALSQSRTRTQSRRHTRAAEEQQASHADAINMQSPEPATRKIKLPGVIDFELVDVEIERLWDDPSTSEASRHSAETCLGICLGPSWTSDPEPQSQPVGLRALHCLR